MTAAIGNTHWRDNLLETAPAKASAVGDIFYATAANAIAALTKGTAYQGLFMNSGATAPEWAASIRSLLTAKGSIVGASAANTPVELPAGADGQAIGYDSAQASGLAAIAVGLSGKDYQGGNLVRNYPSLELADGAQPEWWEVTNDPALTEEDATGETIPQKYERVLKLVVSVDGGGADYAYQDFDDADEPLLDDGVTEVSAGCWVYTSDTGTVTLELYDVDGAASLGTDTTTTVGAWVWLEVLGVTYQDSMRWRVTHSANNATVYVAMPCLNVGAVVRPWRARGLRFVSKYVDSVLSENPGNANWADLDFTAYTSNNTAALALSFYTQGGTVQYAGRIRLNGSSEASYATWVVSEPDTDAGGVVSTQVMVLCDDGQVIEESVTDATAFEWIISMFGYWEWD